MAKSTFEKLAERYNDRLMILTSDVGSGNKVQLKPVFLYHARRTSGMAFHFAMMSAIGAVFKLAGTDSPPLCRRIEDDSLSPDVFQKRFVLISSHSPIGLHERFAEDFLLSTIVREPVSRLASTYMSGCMRSLIVPTTEGFEAFLGKIENRNGTIRQLCGQPLTPEVSSKHLDAALDTLTDKFDSYITMRHTNDLIRHYLSLFRLPNVVMERPNRTHDRFRIDISPYEDFIREQNSLDMQLFEFVSMNYRLPRHEPDIERLSPVTVVIREKKDDMTASKTDWGYMSTEAFIAIVEQHPDVLEDLDWFWTLREKPG